MTNKNQLLCASALSVIFLSAFPVALHAQTASENSNISCIADCEVSGNNSGITTYKPDFFAGYNPVTALDMVRQVPGFSIDNGEQARGFGGTAGNVLINGERPSTKSNGLREILGRIATSRVVSIELIRGSVPGIDMRGLTRAVNVVLCDCSAGGQTTFTVNTRLWRDRAFVTGELIYAVRLFDADITVSLQRNDQGRRPEGTEESFDAFGNLTEKRNEEDQRRFREWQPTFNMEKKFDNGDALRLSGKYWNWMWDRNETSRIYDVTADVLSPNGFDFNTSDNDGNGFEIGGDYEREFSENRSAKLIFVKSRRVENFLNDAENFSAQGFTGAFRVDGGSIQNETILRLLYDWAINTEHTIQFGSEGALNKLNSVLDLFEDTGAGLQQIDLAVSNTKVSEDRGELFGSWVYAPSSKWTLETGLRYEASKISQSGDASRSRTFKFWKPSFSATWNVSKNDQIRTSIERKVAQLNFGNFVSSVNLSDEQTNLGNPELEPDRTWAFETTWEHRFGPKGSLNVKYRRDWITAVQGRVPIDNAFDGPGNLGNAKRWNLNVDARLPLDRVGLKNATLDANWFLQDTSVTDPVTGETRTLQGHIKQNWGLEFRQDLNNIKMAWGWDYNSGNKWRQFRLFEQSQIRRGSGDLDAFIETTHVKGITITAGLDNIFNQKEKRVRTFFDGSRANGIISGAEQRIRRDGRRYTLKVKGTF